MFAEDMARQLIGQRGNNCNRARNNSMPRSHPQAGEEAGMKANPGGGCKNQSAAILAARMEPAGFGNSGSWFRRPTQFVLFIRQNRSTLSAVTTPCRHR